MGVYENVSVLTATIRGMEALAVRVEIAVSSGIPGIVIVGTPDSNVLESRFRVRAALKSLGFEMPRVRYTVNLSPAEIKKSGTGFDLPLAVSILASTGQIPREGLDDCLFVGELGLDGCVRPVRGMMAYERLARQMDKKLVCGSLDLPYRSRCIAVVRELSELRGGVAGLPAPPDKSELRQAPGLGLPRLDFAQVLDQEAAKRALVVSAAGNHGLLMVGPPGSGKSMLAKRLPTILPPLSDAEAEQAMLIHSVAGQEIEGIAQGERPFRAPHHSISMAGMIGGGRPVLPGEVSLAHEGVLFLDELPEFATNVLQSLRQPFEEHEVRLVRVDGVYRFPCDFTFIAAANPCPCGYLGDDAHECTCPPGRVMSYQSRIGGPLKDRIDIHLFVSRPDSSKVVGGSEGASSTQMREAVMRGREFAAWRLSKQGPREQDSAPLEGLGLELGAITSLEDTARRLGFGGRAIVRVARVARTIADLDERESIRVEDILEACAYRDRSEG